MTTYNEPFTFYVTPTAKPRMTRSDRWRQRPIVLRYWTFKDAILNTARQENFNLAQTYRVEFYIAMPKSWSKSHKLEMTGKPHQAKPDLDNLVKAVNDCLCVEDSQIYDIHATKKWAYEDSIVISNGRN